MLACCSTHRRELPAKAGVGQDQEEQPLLGPPKEVFFYSVPVFHLCENVPIVPLSFSQGKKVHCRYWSTPDDAGWNIL